MKILWFLDKEFDVAHNISARMATIHYLEKSHDITVITSYKREKRYSYDIKGQLVYLERIGLPLVKTFYHYFQQLKYVNQDMNLREKNFVLVNSFNIFLLKKLVAIKTLYDLKLILDVRSLPVESIVLKKKLNEHLFAKCLSFAAREFDGITYITDEMYKYCFEKYNMPRHKFAVWSSGVDTDLFTPMEQPSKDSVFRLMYHGAVSRYRGIPNIIKALANLRDHDIEFSLLGAGDELSSVKELTQKLDLEDRVKFIAPVSHSAVSNYINNMDVGILPFPDWPGWNTSSPIKLFEYLACGKPVIVTRIPAHLNVLEGKGFAFWTEKTSPESIAEAILEAFQKRESFPELGREARDFVVKYYTWDTQFAKLDSFIKGL